MVQNMIFWVVCLCLQLMPGQAQLDLPNTSFIQQQVPKQPQPKTPNATPNPQQYFPQQQPQQQPLFNTFNPNYDFGQPQLPYPYNNFLPINNNYQPRPVIQINNRPFPNHNNNNNNNNTRQVNQYNVYGRLDNNNNNFGPGQFGPGYIGHLGPPQSQIFAFPTNFGNYPRQNIVAVPTTNPVNIENVQSEPKREETPPTSLPPSGQIPQQPPPPPQNYGGFGVVQGQSPTPGIQFLPNRPGFDPNVQNGPPINPQQFLHPFPPNFGRFDFGHNVAPPQTVEGNLQVTGQSGEGRGLAPQNNPVVGFYGPPPNLGVFSYPTFSPGFTYPNGQPDQFANPPDAESESIEEQPPAINPK